MKLFVCDYLDYAVNSLESFVVDAESKEEAEVKSIEHLKTLGIPKRYIINIEEV